MGRIACNNGTIDGSDRDAGDPVGMDISLRQRLVDAALICPERTAALSKATHSNGRRWFAFTKSCRGWKFMAFSFAEVVHEIRAV